MYSTPEIKTSESSDVHFSVVFSKGLSLVQWICTGIVRWFFSGVFRLIVMFVISGVIFCPESSGSAPRRSSGSDAHFVRFSAPSSAASLYIDVYLALYNGNILLYRYTVIMFMLIYTPGGQADENNGDNGNNNNSMNMAISLTLT